MSGAAASYRLEGRVTFDNLIALREAGEDAIAGSGDQTVVDVSGLESANSLAVALLMAWFRAAERLGKALSFTGLPDELISIIELSGMDAVLPIENAAEAPGEARP